MKKIVLVLLAVFLIAIPLSSCRHATEAASAPEVLTYLVFGMDDAAENTDVLMLVTLNLEQKTLTCLQLPRDTYYQFGGSQNKVNQLFAYARWKGQNREEAAQTLCDSLVFSLGIPVCGYVGVTTSAFREIVDALGGIRMDLSEDFVFDDGTEAGTICLPKGQTLLDGATAEKFVRFRKAYKRGDLARLDAQKMFLSSFVKTVKNADALSLITVASIVQKNVISDLSILENAKNYLQNRDIFNSLTMTYATMPGEAMLSKTGLSYYILNKNGCRDVLFRCTGIVSDFDPECRFVNSDDTKMINIYYDENADETEYSDDTLGDVRILSQMK